MIGILSDLTLRKNSPVKDQMGNFLLNLFDDFNSQFPFLRVRVSNSLEKLNIKIKYNNYYYGKNIKFK